MSSENELICTLCEGKRREHYDAEGKPITRHVFTTAEGQLHTHEELRKEQQKAQQQVIRLPGAQTNEAGAIGRLCEVLMENNLITASQALYVAGMGPKPDTPSGFRDPGLPSATGGNL